MTQPEFSPDPIQQWLNQQIIASAATSAPQLAPGQALAQPPAGEATPPPAAPKEEGIDGVFSDRPPAPDDGKGSALKLLAGTLVVACLAGGYVSYKLFVSPSSSKGHEASANSRLETPSTHATTIAPHTSAVPSATPSPTISSSPSSPASPVAIPKFDLSGFTIPCETIATVTVSEKVPIGVVEKFASLLGANNNTVNDPNTYSLAPKSDGAADASVEISPTTPIPIQLCVKTATNEIKPETSAPADTYAYAVNLKTLPLQPNFSSLSNNLAPKAANVANNVPSVLSSLAAPGGKVPKNPTPIEAEAAAEEKLNWTDTSQKPNAGIYSQFQGVLASNAKNLTNGALAEMLGQVDAQKAILDQAATAHLRTDLQNYAQTWAANESKTLHTTVPVPSVSLDASGDVASLKTAFLQENPAAVNSTAEGLLTYIVNNPTIKQSKTPPTDLGSAITAYDKLPIAAKNPLPPYAETPPLNNGSNSLVVTPVNPTQNPAPSATTSGSAPTNVTPTGQN